MIKSCFKRKLADIKHRYGNEAVKHFVSFPYCENCGEKRIVCLAIHHIKGKKINEFQTLCLNCHIFVHSPKCKNFTYENEVKLEKQKEQKKLYISIRNSKIISMTKKEHKSTRQIAKEIGLSHVTVWNIIQQYIEKEDKVLKRKTKWKIKN